MSKRARKTKKPKQISVSTPAPVAPEADPPAAGAQPGPPVVEAKADAPTHAATATPPAGIDDPGQVPDARLGLDADGWPTLKPATPPEAPHTPRNRFEAKYLG